MSAGVVTDRDYDMPAAARPRPWDIDGDMTIFPGPAGLMGGWTQNRGGGGGGLLPTLRCEVQASAEVRLKSMGLADQKFQVTASCAQPVVGINFYPKVTSCLGSCTAVVYKPPGDNAEVQTIGLHYTKNIKA
eukprot:jgi/Tetstr1/448100/TSEL_035399.t1